MRVTVSLHEDDVAFPDKCVENRRFVSRSAVIQGAIRRMRSAELVDAYVEAFDDWAGSDDAVLWATTAADGMSPN